MHMNTTYIQIVRICSNDKPRIEIQLIIVVIRMDSNVKCVEQNIPYEANLYFG